MRIVGLERVEKSDRARVTATVVWEDCDRPTEHVYIETRGEPAPHLAPSPDAFLLACVMPAMEYRERRVQVEGAVCPELRNGLMTSLAVLRAWFPEQAAPALEASSGFRPGLPRTPSRLASFLSGGIDALATLRSNRIDFPLDHPGSIRDGLYIFGLNSNDFVANAPVPERVADFERRADRMAALARCTGVDLITVYTNVRFLAKDFPSWRARGMGAGLAAVAHAFSSRFSRALIASGGRTGSWPAIGTHPLLDPNFSSAALRIKHDGLWLSRLEKTAMVADWDVGLAHLQVCQRHELPDSINCGSCNKCVRTMVHLAALGKLEATEAFPSRDVTSEMIHAAELPHDLDAELMWETADLFQARGRPDLAAAVRSRVARYREMKSRPEWRRALSGWDNRLKGVLSRLAGSLRGRRG